ncbi:MAG: hypothetical protein EOQ39_18860 [Mesorhizobium sp.]|uniref:hypothetical protein n=1 Tax=Mesorhizobium sp. TaxID=1871066 RepID=UPI000FE88BE2|nr:hypothetical protein [Mesorhizobium sp.]RWB08767.1 MAG: hypothetical protein EOQ37_04480 [Mesorhizobium sp.]RWB13582.1 MAG: hypothetical protein EOQ39_18860 [Mesorhizobium sp.]
MTIPDQHDQYLVERINRVERELEAQKAIITGLVTKSAVTDTLLEGIRDALKDIKEQITQTRSSISRVGFIFLAAFVTSFVGALVLFIVKGGLSLVP